MDYRIEKDTMGDVKVPADKYWGAQTERSRNNFKIGGSKQQMPLEIIYGFAYLKKAAAHTNCELGVLTAEKRDAISAVCDEILEGKLDDQFPLVIWQTGSGTQSNMNTNEVIANRAHVIAGNKLGEGTTAIHPNDDVNKSQSSNDTFPTGMHIACYKMVVETTIPGVEKLRDTLKAKAEKYMNVVKIGRTHLMDATPLTVGQEFSGYVSQLNHGLKALRNTLDHLSELALGGTAVGTGINTPKGYAELVAKKIAEFTELPFVTAENKFEALAAHDAIVETHGALKQLAMSLMKIGNDIRLLASGPRCGIGELDIPANEPGSSIMPGKVNPTQAEALTMVCAQVIGNDSTITVAGQAGNFELNVMLPVVAHNLLQSIDILGNAAKNLADRSVSRLEVRKDVIADMVGRNPILVTALNPIIGYDLAAKIAKKAFAESRPLKEVAKEMTDLSDEELDNALDPIKMTKGGFTE